MGQPPISYNKFLIIAIIAFVVTGIVIVAMAHNNIANIIGKAKWVYLGIALATTSISYFFQVFSYVILNRLFQVNPGFGLLSVIGFASIAIGNVVSTPFAITEHGIRALLLVPRGFKAGDVLGASIFHSFIKDVAILVLAPGVMIYQSLTDQLSAQVVRIFIIVAVLALLLLVIFCLIFIFGKIRRAILGALARIWRFITHHSPKKQFDDFDKAIEQTNTHLKQHPRTGLYLLGLMVGDWIFALATLELCFNAFGLVTPFTTLTSGFIVGKTATVLSLIPGGIGVQSTSTGGIFALLGIPFKTGTLVAELFRISYQYIPYIASLVIFRQLLRNMRQSRQHQPAASIKGRKPHQGR